MELIISWFIGIVLFVWLLRLLIPLIMPLVLRWVIKRMSGRAHFMSNFGMQEEQPTQETEQKSTESDKMVGDDVGEYVDFEEIKKK